MVSRPKECGCCCPLALFVQHLLLLYSSSHVYQTTVFPLGGALSSVRDADKKQA